MNQLPITSPQRIFWTALAGIVAILGIIAGILYMVFMHEELIGETAEIRKQYEIAGVPCGSSHPEYWMDSAQRAIKEGNKKEIAFFSVYFQEKARHDACLKSMDATIERISTHLSEHMDESYPRDIQPLMVNRHTHAYCNQSTCIYGNGDGIKPEEPGYPKDMLPEPLPLNKYTLRKCRKFFCGDDDRLVYGDPGYPKVWWQEMSAMDKSMVDLIKY